MQSNATTPSFASALLEWYDRHARIMPWRVPPKERKQGVRPDPYHVWLSEVMLQQTQVATVRDYFLNFSKTWPSVSALARADTEDVMKAWAGLGYYSRARNLKKCAEAVAFDLNAHFPETAGELQKLPGIGPYTAAAIAAIAFDEPVAVVDGNIERVIARYYRIETELPGAKPEITEKTQALLDRNRPGDFAQAMMDLGATICTPKRPACALCLVNDHCAAFGAGEQETYPRKAPKSNKPVRAGAGFVIVNADGAVFLRKRAENGLLGGMTEVPGTAWTSRTDGKTGRTALPFPAKWTKCPPVRHTFTHFHLDVEVWHCQTDATEMDGWWSSPAELAGEALPTVMKKIISSAIPDAFRK